MYYIHWRKKKKQEVEDIGGSPSGGSPDFMRGLEKMEKYWEIFECSVLFSAILLWNMVLFLRDFTLEQVIQAIISFRN